MRLHRIVKGIIRLFTALLLLFIGASLLMLWSDPAARLALYEFMGSQGWVLALFGIGLLLFGGLLLFNLWQKMQKNVYYHTLGERSVMVDETLFDSYLQRYWKTLFPEHPVSHRIVLKQDKMSIVAELPPTPESERQALLDRIVSELDGLFTKLIGFDGKVTFSATFLDK